MSAASATVERRSPLALAHDPPVQRTAWTTDRELTAEGFLADARSRGGWDEVAWERLLRHGGMHLDRVRWEPESPPAVVPAGTSVVAYLHVAEPVPVAFGRDRILLDVLAEEGVVAVDKPAWLTVQGSRASRLSSLERALRLLFAEPRLTPVHRLDRETTGVVVFARDSRAASVLGRQFERRTARKDYLAWVSPAPVRQRWDVAARLVRIAHPSHSLFAMADEHGSEGRPSRTSFELLDARAGRALVRATPHTGRTHQLRVHLSGTGTPIVGDSLYGCGWSPGTPGSASRLQLHAASLGVELPSGRSVVIAAPPPPDFGDPP